MAKDKNSRRLRIVRHKRVRKKVVGNLDRPEIAEGFVQARKGFQVFDRAEDGGQNCGKVQRGLPEIFDRAELAHTYVVPVLNKSIEIFEKPPEHRAQQQQR